MPNEKLERIFNFHPAKDQSVGDLHQFIRNECKKLAYSLNAVLPYCHELDRCIDAIDDAMKHANAAVAREMSR